MDERNPVTQDANETRSTAPKSPANQENPGTSKTYPGPLSHNRNLVGNVRA